MTIIPPRVDELLHEIVVVNASDLFLSAGSPAQARITGELRVLGDGHALTADETTELVLPLIPAKSQASFEDGHDVDFSFGWGAETRVRANAFHQKGQPAIVLRIMPRDIPDFDTLGLPHSVRNFAGLHRGLVLFTGPTGSGKTTTLASILDHINRHRRVHIITVEDPIEFEHRSRLALINQRAVGEDTPSFAAALRSAVREAPDVVLVGELRDGESMAAAMTLAEVGHLVFATVHTNDTSQAVDRIIDSFPGNEQPQIRAQFASCLTAIVHQRLLPRTDAGRVAAFEVMIATAAIRNLIRADRVPQLRNQLITGQNVGMMTLEMSLKDLCGSGFISYETAAAQTIHLGDL